MTATQATVDGMTAATQEAEAPTVRMPQHGPTVRPQSYDELERFCKTIMQSKLIPSGFNNSADVMVAVQSGETLGMTPMQSVQSLHVIEGRPTLTWDTMLATCMRSPIFDHAAFEITETGTFPQDDFAMRVTVRRRQQDCKPYTHSFSISDAKTAGLWERQSKTGKPMPWKSYPKRMLMINAGRPALKNIFADVLHGVECRETMVDSLMDQIDTRPAFDPSKSAADSLADSLKAKHPETKKETEQAPPPVSQEAPANASGGEDSHSLAAAPPPKEKAEGKGQQATGAREADAQAAIANMEAITKLRKLIRKLWGKLDDETKAAQLDNCSLDSIDDVETMVRLADLRDIADALLGAH